MSEDKSILEKIKHMIDHSKIDEERKATDYLYYNYKNEDYIKELEAVQKKFPYKMFIPSSSINPINHIRAFISNKGLTVGIEYYDDLANRQLFFANESDKDAAQKYIQRQAQIDEMIKGAGDVITSIYPKVVFREKNKLKVSIKVIPYKETLQDFIKSVIHFYISNNYEIPENSAVFIDNFIEVDLINRCFTVYVKNEEDAAALSLIISELAESAKI